MLYLILSLFLFLGSPTPPPPELEAAVKDYWTLMAKNDKFAALKYVLKGSENNFISLRQPSIRSWKLTQVEMLSATEARVTIETEALLPNMPSVQVLQARYNWVNDGTSWKIRILKPNFRMDPMLSARADKKKPLKAELRVTPRTVKIPFLNSIQRARVTVANGTPKAAHVERVEFDEEKFELTDRLTVIEPGQSLHMTLDYKGKETAKNLESRLTLVFKHDDKERIFQVPIIYNYLSAETREFFGLDEKAAQKLRRGDRLIPAKRPNATPGPAKSTAPPQPPPG